MKQNRKPAVRLAALAVALSLLLCSCAEAESEQTQAEVDVTEVGTAAAQTEQTDEAVLPADTNGADKTESVTVTADANGNPEKTEVTVVLKPAADGGAIADVSTLTDIRNSDGDEEFTQDGTSLSWQNLGESITYKGETDAALPVSVKVTYYLDGAEISPDELAGKSGKVKIRFDYTNNSSRTVKVEGKEYTTITPYAAISVALLPEEHFANVEVENGSVMDMEGQRAAVGIALPGLADALKLGDFEPTEDVELPEYVEITADCVDFELDFTATILSNGLFEDIEDDDLDDLDELSDDLSELSDAGGELTDGVSSLADGVNTLRDYYKQYMEGVNEFGDGVLQAGKAITALAEQQNQLAAVTAQLDSGLAALNTSIAAMDFSGTGSVSAAGAQLAADAEALQTAVTALQGSLDDISAFASDAQAYEDAVTAAVSSAKGSLDSVDLSGLNDTAIQQASDVMNAVLPALLEGTDLPDEQRQQILDGANAAVYTIDLSGDVNAAQANIDSALDALDSIPDLDVPDLTLDLTAVNTAVEALQNDAAAIKSAGTSLAGVSAAVTALQQSLPALSQAATGVNQGTAAIAQYMTTAADGMKSMNKAVSALKEGGSGLADGMDELYNGVVELYDGVKEFDEEGLQKLGDMGGSDLQKLLNRFKALREADATAPAFSGSVEGAEVETGYIIETAEIRSK